MVRLGGFMDILERSLAAADAMLDGMTPEEFEKEYLSIKNGIGPLAKNFIGNARDNAVPILEARHYKSLQLEVGIIFQDKKMKRVHRSSLIYSQTSSFHECADYDFSEAA